MTVGQEHYHVEKRIASNMEQETVEEFKDMLYEMQKVRRRIVEAIAAKGVPVKEDVESLRNTLDLLVDPRTNEVFQRHMTTPTQSFDINIKDEIIGLKKDMIFLERLLADNSISSRSIESVFSTVHLPEILAPYHPISEDKFSEEMENVVRFLNHFVSDSSSIKPAFITDWDGTMKNYCSQYATNLQPIYSAIGMADFASKYTRLSAVLTAGPLRGPGILDLTALPIDGPIIFSGSWGREWRLGGKRVVFNGDISDQGIDALNRLDDEMKDLLHNGEYSQFELVGSGIQRKVDRITLGVQTVCNLVESHLSSRYQDAVRERIHRVDPNQQMLAFEQATDLEVEVCCIPDVERDEKNENDDQKGNKIWNKANGVARLSDETKVRLDEGRVLICGDTSSDIPMLEYAMGINPLGTFALFVGQSASLEKRVRDIVNDDNRVAYISCPDVFHAALARFLSAQSDID